MATTAPERVTDLTRRYRLDVNTAADPNTHYEQVMGVVSMKLVEELRTVDDETFEDSGAMREEVTGVNRRIELKIKHSLNAAGTSRNPVHAFLRSKFLALTAGDAHAAQNEFGLRYYDRNGLTGDAFEGRAYVKSWSPNDDKGASDEITLVLQIQGPLTQITNPAASQVPVVTSVVPNTGDEAGGELVNIYGTHFTGATDVDFGANAADFTVVSDSHIVAVAPAGSAGTVQVKVTTAAGASSNTDADDYTYTS